MACYKVVRIREAVVEGGQAAEIRWKRRRGGLSEGRKVEVSKTASRLPSGFGQMWAVCQKVAAGGGRAGRAGGPGDLVALRPDLGVRVGFGPKWTLGQEMDPAFQAGWAKGRGQLAEGQGCGPSGKG